MTLTGPGTDPQGPEVEALVDYYRGAAGEHPDWDEYRSVMVSDRRVLMALTRGRRARVVTAQSDSRNWPLGA